MQLAYILALQVITDFTFRPLSPKITPETKQQTLALFEEAEKKEQNKPVPTKSSKIRARL